MKRYLFNVILGLQLIFIVGCANLEQGGAYAPVGQQADKALYLSDVTYKMAYDALDTAFKFEQDNRLALWALNPNIKRTLDKVRAEAWVVHKQWAMTRSVYVANPIPDNLDALNQICANLQRLVVTAQAAITAVNKGE